MGVSNDALIAYGLDLGEDIPEALQAMFDQYDIGGTYFDDLVDAILNIDQNLSYSEKKAARNKFPVDLLQHCSYDYPMYFLAIRGTDMRAYRGSPKAIPIDHFKLSNEQIIAFNRFCVDIGVDPAEADWQIFSMNG